MQLKHGPSAVIRALTQPIASIRLQEYIDQYFLDHNKNRPTREHHGIIYGRDLLQKSPLPVVQLKEHYQHEHIVRSGMETGASHHLLRIGVAMKQALDLACNGREDSTDYNDAIRSLAFKLWIDKVELKRPLDIDLLDFAGTKFIIPKLTPLPIAVYDREVTYVVVDKRYVRRFE